MTVVTAEFEQSEADILEFQRHHVRRGQTRLRTLLPVAAMVGAAVMMGLLAIMLGFALGDAMSASVLAVFAVGSLAFGVMIFAYSWFLLPWIAAQRALSSPASRAQLIGPRAFSMSEGGVAYRYPAGESSVAWAGVNRVESDAAAVYIYFSAANAVWLPRRAFVTEEEFVRFGELARQYFAASRGVPPQADVTPL